MLPSLSLSLNKKRKDVAEQRLRVTELDLFPPTSRGYPIFDYEKVCGEKLDSSVQPKEKSNEEFRDRDAEEIVRRLEANYGTGSVSMSASTSVGLKIAKRSKKVRKFAPEDVMDKGLGYVQEDDFIDDTEAYDEWVPTTMDTAKGGHYVNEGPLEFRQIDLESSTSSDSTSNGSGSSASTVPETSSDENEGNPEVNEQNARKERKLKKRKKSVEVIRERLVGHPPKLPRLQIDRKC